MNYGDLPKNVTLFEVGPRDGLQNEREFIPTEKKIELVNRLSASGCRKVEATSFAHPKWVPQLKDAKEVFAGIDKIDGVTYSAFVPNLKGLDSAAAAGLREVVTIISASESHNKNNINETIAESLDKLATMSKVAEQHRIKLRAYIGTSFGCPIEGTVPPEKVADLASRMEQCGAYEISLGDTTGMAGPRNARTVCELVGERLTTASLAAHFHQCDGIEFANVLAAMETGITVLDASVGGLGGCPYAPGATGNIATETLVEMFDRMGIATGIDLATIKECGQFAQSLASQPAPPD